MAMIADVDWAFREPHSKDRQRASTLASGLVHGLLLLFLILTGVQLGGGSGRKAGEGTGKALEVTLVHGEAKAPAAAAAPKVTAPMHPRSQVKEAPQPKPQVVKRAEAIRKVARQPVPQAQAAPVLPSVAAGFGKGTTEAVYGTDKGRDSSTPAGGTGTGQGSGAGVEKGINGLPLPPKKGRKLTAQEVRERMVGHGFKLEIGRVQQANSNRLINSTIKLNADGSTDVNATAYYYQTGHALYSSTDEKSGKGRWWIEGNRWCHQSEDIQYNTKNCYDVTVDGPTIRFYYAECGLGSSLLCAQGQLAAQGTME